MRDTELYDEDTDTYYGLDYVDEDDDFDRYHCPHGTYIGTPGGPDILCGWCEEGISMEEYKEIMKAQRAYRTREKAHIYALHFLVDGTWQTFSHVPGSRDKGEDGREDVIRWMDEVRDEIDAMSPSDLLLIEETVYRGYGY